MVRFLLSVMFSAGFGSIIATLPTVGIEEPRFTIGFSIITMFFSVPGAIMLVGLRATLEERLPPRLSMDIVTAVAGAVVGSLVLGIPAAQHDWGAKTGAFYGLTTGFGLILFDRLWRSLSRKRRLSNRPD